MAKRRTSILVDKATYERYEMRARRHGTTVSEEMRQALDEAVCDDNPNQAFLELMEDMAKYEWKPGPPYGSKEAKDEMLRAMYRDNFGREPDSVIIADSNVVLASFDPNDPEHQDCQRAMRSQRDVVMLPTPAVTEVAYFLETRAGARREAAFLRSVAAGVPAVLEPEPSDYARAADLVEQYANFPLGTVDALIVAMAERLEVTTLLTLDRRHFGAVRPVHCDAFNLVP